MSETDLRLPVPAASRPQATVRLFEGVASPAERVVAEETAVALTYNRLSHAVMMATPADLEDFALGFSLAEGIIGRAADIEELDIVATPLGVELRMWVADALMERLERRRRHIAGPTGCGLCGMDSLADALRSPPPVAGTRRFRADEIAMAVASLRPRQTLNHATRAVHAAGFWDGGLVAVREDVGRHNALDKLAGAILRSGRDPSGGILVMTSRISVELVQKAATLGVGLIAAVSAPTALAIRVAEQAGLTLVGVARDDGYEVFTKPDAIMWNPPLG